MYDCIGTMHGLAVRSYRLLTRPAPVCRIPTTGGPDQNDQYRDDCQNYKQAEVAIDYVSPYPPFVRTRIDPRQSD